MTPNASKQGKLDSFAAIFLFILFFLVFFWGGGGEWAREIGTICPFGVLSVICILHTAYARLDVTYVAPPRGLKSPPQKECLPGIVGPPGMRVLCPPAL